MLTHALTNINAVLCADDGADLKAFLALAAALAAALITAPAPRGSGSSMKEQGKRKSGGEKLLMGKEKRRKPVY